MLDFILPSENDREAVLSFYNEIEKDGGKCIGFANHKDFDRWLLGMRNRHAGKDLPEGYVRENFYLCYNGEKLIGVFSLKFELTEYLLNYGGHIGYAVRPSERQKGYGSLILKQGLSLAKQLGFGRILCVCDEDNVSSEKIIRKNGGVFDNMLFDAEENVFVRRFWVEF